MLGVAVIGAGRWETVTASEKVPSLASAPRRRCPPKSITWLAGRLARLLGPRPPGVGGNPPLALAVRLDAVAAPGQAPPPA